MAITDKRKRHKLMERAIRSLMGANLPPRFKFKDTYASIEVPTAYEQHLPTQQEIEAKFDELETQEEAVEVAAAEATVISKFDSVITSNLEVGTSNLFVDTETGRVGVGTTNPQSKLTIESTNGNHLRLNYDNLWYNTIERDSSGDLNFREVRNGGTDNILMTIKTQGNVGIGEASPSYKLHVSGGVSYFPDGISTPGYHAQLVMTGGGNVTWDGSNLLWSERIIALPVEKTEFSSDGYIDIYCPTSGTITYYKQDGTTGTATCTSSGVPVSAWEALWYVVTSGQSNASDQTKFVLTAYGNPNWRPDSNWLLIAARNYDGASNYHLKFMPTNSVLRTWIAPSFTDSWVNYNTEYNQCGYYKDSENRVHLRGLVKNGTAGNNYAIFVLPVGYRPERRHLFCVMTNPNAAGRIDITNDGRVRPYGVNSGWVSLDNISFTAV